MKTFKLILILAILICGGILCLKNSFLTSAQIRSSKDEAFKNWRPTREINGINFVGNQKCLECHSEKQQLETPMAHAILKPPASRILDEIPSKPFKNGIYTYEI